MGRVRSPNYVTFGPTETIVTFASDRGQLRRNDGGEFFYRDFTDGRFTCASPDLERQLIDAGVRAGAPVGITRTTHNRSVIWKVRIIAQVTQMPQREIPPTTTSQPKPNGFPDRVYAKVEPPAPVFPESDALPAAPPAEPLSAEGPNLITRCMRAAVEAAADATARGREIGFEVTLGAPEIQALACTLYIQASHRLASPNGGNYARRPNGRATSTAQQREAGA